jgi:hypothetical protein
VAARVCRLAPEGGVRWTSTGLFKDLKAERDVLASAIECLEKAFRRSREEARAATGMDETGDRR